MQSLVPKQERFCCCSDVEQGAGLWSAPGSGASIVTYSANLLFGRCLNRNAGPAVVNIPKFAYANRKKQEKGHIKG